jgi:hypothetical protein
VIQGGDGDDIIFGDARRLFGIGGDDKLHGSGGLVGDSVESTAGVCGDDLLDASGATEGTFLSGDVPTATSSAPPSAAGTRSGAARSATCSSAMPRASGTRPAPATT